MKSDLDRLMQKYAIDVIFVYGGEEPNMQRAYLMNGVHANGYVIKKQGEAPIAIVNGMERDEAAKSGLTIHTWEDYNFGELYKQHKDDRAAFERALLGTVFEKLGVRGRVGLYGTADVMRLTWLLREVFPTLPNVEIVADHAAIDLFQNAYETKDPNEIARLQEVAQRASAVMRATRDFISQHRAAKDGIVVDEDGEALTVGDVKQFVRQQNLENNLENSAGLIFAQGRDAGIPHSSGQDDQILHTGQSIVFDYFPRDTESGYFHDVTRTWSIGYAEPEIQTVYDQVLEAFHIVNDSAKVGDDGSIYQNRVCDVFESHGHPTTRSKPDTHEGYVHSLGHGLGLNIHEAPHFGIYPRGGILAAGNVFTIEPGLYYPDRGYGVRIEDTVYFDEQGVLRTLTDVPYDLVLPLNG